MRCKSAIKEKPRPLRDRGFPLEGWQSGLLQATENSPHGLPKTAFAVGSNPMPSIDKQHVPYTTAVFVCKH